MEPVCEACGERHHPRQAHRFPGGSNDGDRSAKVEVGHLGVDQSVVSDDGEERGTGPVAEKSVGVVRKQRWSRGAYNAYQREYMRGWRIRQRGR